MKVSGAAARAKAADLRADTAEGRNPMVTKQARKAAEAQAANDTFETLAREWRASRIGGWDAGTAKRIMDALERHVFPTFGQRRYPPRS
ncbi:integrase, partial [Pseudomonas syringae pv. actinidiae]|nr:integrase [Pseudomonas syringae pv. actinidiae]